MTDALADSLRARGPKSASRKLTVPEIEYESDGESVREGSVEPSDINSTGALSVGSGERKGSATPPVQEEEEDEDKELKKKVSYPLCVGMTIPIPTLISQSFCVSAQLFSFPVHHKYCCFQCKYWKLWSRTGTNNSCGGGLGVRLILCMVNFYCEETYSNMKQPHCILKLVQSSAINILASNVPTRGSCFN